MKNEEQIYKELGETIASFRKSNKLTQTELAEKVSMSRASIANIEVGRQKVFVHQLYIFALAFGLTGIEQLLPILDDLGAIEDNLNITSASKLTNNEIEKVRNLLDGIHISGNE